MKRPPKILWTEGVTLRPQHFQQQDRYHETRLHSIAAALHPYAWGVREVTWDEDALAHGRLRVESLSLVFQDGEPYDAPGPDLLPEAVDLSALPASEGSVTFYAALPDFRSHGGNLAQAQEQDLRQARFRRSDVETPDLYAQALEAGIAYLPKQACLLSHLAPRSGYLSVPIVRLRRSATVGFEVDRTFMAPSLSIAAAPALARQLEALMHKLQAKIDALYAAQREPSQDMVVEGGDAASFWLLQTISAGCATLRHHAHARAFHPERLFQDLLGLAGGLMAFSRKVRIGDLPGYEHDQPGPGFAALDAIVRELVDTVIGAKFVTIPLVQDATRPSYFEGTLPPAVLDQTTLMLLAVRAELAALELVASVPVRFKVAAPGDVGRLVASALPGVELVHLPQVPAAVPVRPNTYYFALNGKSALYENLLESKAVSVYVPSGIRELALELFAIPA